MSLVDVLAGLVILALAVVSFVPMANRAMAAPRYAADQFAALQVLADTPLPRTASGRRELPYPVGCSLAWETAPVLVAGSRSTPHAARVVRMRIVNAEGVVQSERLVPMLTDRP